MLALKLNEETQKNVALCIGKPFSDIVGMTSEEGTEAASEKKGSKVVFSKKRDFRKIGRGNPLLSKRRIRTIEDVNEKIDSIKLSI